MTRKETNRFDVDDTVYMANHFPVPPIIHGTVVHHVVVTTVDGSHNMYSVLTFDGEILEYEESELFGTEKSAEEGKA